MSSIVYRTRWWHQAETLWDCLGRHMRGMKNVWWVLEAGLSDFQMVTHTNVDALIGLSKNATLGQKFWLLLWSLITYLFVRKWSWHLNVKSLLLNCKPISLCFVLGEKMSQVPSLIGILLFSFSEVVLAFPLWLDLEYLLCAEPGTGGQDENPGPSLLPTRPWAQRAVHGLSPSCSSGKF